MTLIFYFDLANVLEVIKSINCLTYDSGLNYLLTFEIFIVGYIFENIFHPQTDMSMHIYERSLSSGMNKLWPMAM